MPEAKHIRIYFEGNDDKAFLEKLRVAQLLPDSCELAQRTSDQDPGKDGLIRQLLPFVRPVSGVGGNAVVLVDLDELTHAQRFEWFRKQLEQELQSAAPKVIVEHGPGINERVRIFHLAAEGRQGRVAIIGAGLPDDTQLADHYKIDRFAIDDWILRLIQNERVFAAISDLQAVPYAVAMAKFIEVADLFRKNGLEVRKAKTYVQILRALAAIGPSTAVIVERVVQKGIETLARDEFRAVVHPLLDDLDAALKALSSN